MAVGRRLHLFSWELVHGATWMFLPADPSRVSDPRQRGGSHSGFADFISEATNYHFCHIPFIASGTTEGTEESGLTFWKGEKCIKKLWTHLKSTTLEWCNRNTVLSENSFSQIITVFSGLGKESMMGSQPQVCPVTLTHINWEAHPLSPSSFFWVPRPIRWVR